MKIVKGIYDKFLFQAFFVSNREKILSKLQKVPFSNFSAILNSLRSQLYNKLYWSIKCKIITPKAAILIFGTVVTFFFCITFYVVILTSDIRFITNLNYHLIKMFRLTLIILSNIFLTKFHLCLGLKCYTCGGVDEFCQGYI